MNDRKIEQIKANLRNIFQQIAEMGEEPPPEIQALLMQVIERSQAQIQELRSQGEEQAPNQTPIPESARLLWILSGGQPEAFAQYLGTFPDQALNAMQRNPAQMQQVLAQLAQQMPQGQGGQLDGVPQADLNSSNIYGFKYDQRSGRLKVRFQNGSTYGYDGVPPEIFRIFQHGAVPAKTTGKNKHGEWWTGKVPSLGAAFHALIRNGNYSYQRLS